jgi:hypothetical protein
MEENHKNIKSNRLSVMEANCRLLLVVPYYHTSHLNSFLSFPSCTTKCYKKNWHENSKRLEPWTVSYSMKHKQCLQVKGSEVRS